MSYSIVRTCDRCGTRAERSISTPAGAQMAAKVIQSLLGRPACDQGCPSCDPEGAKAAGIDLDMWRADVARARGHRPA